MSFIYPVQLWSMTEELHHFDRQILDKKKLSKDLYKERQSDHKIIGALCLVFPHCGFCSRESKQTDDAEL